MKSIFSYAAIFFCLAGKGLLAQVEVPVAQGVSADTSLNHLFTRDLGWNGGDGAYSLLLPDGRLLWWFGDSFYGSIDPQRVRKGQKNVMVRNAILVQGSIRSSGLVSLNPETNGKVAAFFTFRGADEHEYWYWPMDAIVCGDTLMMTLMHMRKTGEGMWGFGAVSVDLALISLPDMKTARIIQQKFPGPISYGADIYSSGDGYTYIYGTSRKGLVTMLHMARVYGANLTQPWQFLGENGWQDHPSEHAIHTNISSMFSIWEENGRFWLFTQEPNLGRKLLLYEGEGPAGPFTSERLLYEVPESHGSNGMFSYNAIIHTELSSAGEWVVSYSINPHNFWDNFNQPGSADKYRPVFIRVRKELAEF